MASVTILSSTPVSTATFGNQNNLGAFSSPSVPSRRDKTTSVTSMLLKAHDNPFGDTNLENQKGEERIIALSSASDAIVKMEESTVDVMRSYMASHIDTNQDPAAKALATKIINDIDKLFGEDLTTKDTMENLINHKGAKKHVAAKEQTAIGETYKRKQWEYLVNQGNIIQGKFVELLRKMLSTRHDSSFDRYLVRYLAYPANGEEKARVPLAELATAFHSLRYVPNMEKRADNIQRLQALENPETVELMFPVWLKSELRPFTVYDMMPIAASKLLTEGVGDRAGWSQIREQFKQWLKYLKMFNDQHDTPQMRQIRATEATGLEVSPSPERGILWPLVKHSRNRREDLVEFIREAQADKELLSFSRAMHRELLANYPLFETLMFKRWAEMNVKPQEVYESMPISTTTEGDAFFHENLAQSMR